MRLPDGRECPHYYVDTRRWHEGQEERCLLLADTEDAERWTIRLCRQCPVPDIRRANACPNMTLHARIERHPWQFWKRPSVKVHATCTKSEGPVKDPHVGCGHCHQAIEFVVAEEKTQK
jgi:hypothetical protein